MSPASKCGLSSYRTILLFSFLTLHRAHLLFYRYFCPLSLNPFDHFLCTTPTLDADESLLPSPIHVLQLPVCPSWRTFSKHFPNLQLPSSSSSMCPHPCTCVHTHTHEYYYKELTHVIMEAETSHTRDLEKPVVSFEGPSQRASGIDSSLSLKV